MAHQEDGWPLGLQPLNVRVQLGRHNNSSGSISFNTLLTGSHTSSTASSSDLDTESTGSFFHDKSITLGSLIGVSSIFELSKRSIRVRKIEASKNKRSSKKAKTWLFSLCSSREATDTKDMNNDPPSLGHFLAVERRVANEHRRNQSPCIYGLDQLPLAQPRTELNSLFFDGHLVPPRRSPWHGSEADSRSNGGLEHGNGYGVPVLCSCICPQSSH